MELISMKTFGFYEKQHHIPFSPCVPSICCSSFCSPNLPNARLSAYSQLSIKVNGHKTTNWRHAVVRLRERKTKSITTPRKSNIQPTELEKLTKEAIYAQNQQSISKYRMSDLPEVVLTKTRMEKKGPVTASEEF